MYSTNVNVELNSPKFNAMYETGLYIAHVFVFGNTLLDPWLKSTGLGIALPA